MNMLSSVPGSDLMKSVGAVLIAVLILHLQCAGSCLAESLGSTALAPPATEQPPCHKHAETPSDKSQPSHDRNELCTQGPVIAGKVVFQSVAVLPAVSPNLLQPRITTTRQLIQERPAGIVTSPVPISILRI